MKNVWVMLLSLCFALLCGCGVKGDPTPYVDPIKETPKRK